MLQTSSALYIDYPKYPHFNILDAVLPERHDQGEQWYNTEYGIHQDNGRQAEHDNRH